MFFPICFKGQREECKRYNYIRTYHSYKRVVLRRILSFIVSQAIWVSLCAACLVFQTTQLLHLQPNNALIAFVFCATLCSYNLHYILAGAISTQNLKLSLFSARPASAIALMAGFAGASFFLKNAHIPLQPVCIAVLLTLAYSVPLLPFKHTAFTRKAGFLKTILLAFTWMFVTAYLPLVQQQLQYSVMGILIMAKRFLFMLMLCIIFDNRDVAVDKVHGLHSLATDLPPKAMQWLITSVFISLFVLNFFLGRHGAGSRQVIALQLSALATLLVYFYSRKKRGYFFYYFMVDGMMVLMVLLTSIASI